LGTGGEPTALTNEAQERLVPPLMAKSCLKHQSNLATIEIEQWMAWTK
jgi:hypothetical protein